MPEVKEMRCFGLTDDRRRCPAEAAGVTGYCLQHQQEMGPGVTWDKRGILRSLRRRWSRLRVADDVAFDDLPAWLKRSSTATVIHHLLHNPDSTIRWTAAFILRRRRDPAAIEPLWEVLQRERFSDVRQQAAVALGKIGTPAVLSPLIEGLWHDRDARVRQVCAIALGNLGHPAAAPDLAQVLEREPAFFVRWDCILALGQVGDRTTEPLLRQLANTESTEVLQRACYQALAMLRRRTG